MKKLQNISLMVVGLLVLMGGTYVFAGGVWNTPSATAPTTIISIPVHEGASQVKDGGVAVDGFLASQAALFKQEVFLNGTVRAVSPTNGLDVITISAPITATGDISASKGIKSTLLANNTGTETVCADSVGAIVLCNTSNAITPPGPSTGTANPTGTVKVVKKGISSADTLLYVDGFINPFGSLSGDQSVSLSQPVGSYTFDAYCTPAPGFNGNQQDPSSPKVISVSPSSLIATVLDGQTTTITVTCDCVRDTGGMCL